MSATHELINVAIEEKRALALHRQPTTLRRCLKCDGWMHSTGADHRICNPCKGEAYYRGLAGKRVKATGGKDEE